MDLPAGELIRVFQDYFWSLRVKKSVNGTPPPPKTIIVETNTLLVYMGQGMGIFCDFGSLLSEALGIYGGGVGWGGGRVAG